MKRNLFFAVFSALFALVSLSGCKQINVAEVLQQPKNSSIYTQHNLWYDANQRISSLNYQSGKVIPFGTEVKINKATNTRIDFTTTKDGQKYIIEYRPEWMMIPVQSYIKQAFTLDDRAKLAKGLSKAMIRAIEKGQIQKGMTRREVRLISGNPPASRTPDLTNDTWIYWIDRFSTIRVIFKNDRVVEILTLK